MKSKLSLAGISGVLLVFSLVLSGCPPATTTPTVTGVIISPATATVARYGTQQFTATVTGDNSPAQTVIWDVQGGVSETTISTSGLLTVAFEETAETLTVTATSTDDTSKSGTATVYINQLEMPMATLVEPSTASVGKGGIQQFTAVVAGGNDPDQTVTWTVTGGSTGTTISTEGLLTVADGETAETLTVTATSTAVTSKPGTATVTVYAGDYDGPLTDIAGVSAYLSIPSGGATAANPVPLKVQLNLPDDWNLLLYVITTRDKYVALDLSACVMADTEFGSGMGHPGESKIVSLVLPDAATSIRSGAVFHPIFKRFTVLSSVSGSAVETVGGTTFSGCTSLTEVSFPAATYIGYEAFSDCTALTEVSLPAAMSIGDYAFSGCTALTTVNLSAVLTEIYGNSFRGCAKLTTITVDSANTEYKAENGMLLSKDGTWLIVYPSASGSVTLPGVTSILSEAFSNCTALTEVSLPAATLIGASAFSGCTSLTEVSFPAATYIGYEAFSGCTSLSSVSLPAATSIGDYAFSDCTNLSSVSLPEATSIGSYAFRYTDGIALTITLGNTPPSVAYRMFYGVSASKFVTVKVPSDAVSSYDATWRDAFKGVGNNGSVGIVNSSISLNIAAITG